MPSDPAAHRTPAEAAAQRNLERLATLGATAAGVAHDFNNLLTVILGRCELLLAAADGAELSVNARHHIALIQQACTDGATLVRRLQGRPAAAAEPVELQTLLQDVLEFASPRWQQEAERSGVEFQIKLELAPLPAQRLDAAVLREVLVNLIFNALDAMPAGGTVNLRLLPAPEPAIEVADTGEGIAPELLDRIFEPYFTTRAHGTGIGLAICRDLMHQLGGEISVESVLGSGTTMRLHLPLMPVEVEDLVD